MEIEEAKELLAKREAQFGSYGITIGEQDDGEHYELYVDGELDSNYLTAEEVYAQIITLYRGIAIAQAKTEEKLEVPTSAGVLKAFKCTDPGQPGICVMLQPAGYDVDIDMSYVSVYEDAKYAIDNERPVDVSIMTYGNVYDEDYTSKVMIRREDVMEVLRETA